MLYINKCQIRSSIFPELIECLERMSRRNLFVVSQDITQVNDQKNPMSGSSGHFLVNNRTLDSFEPVNVELYAINMLYN